MGLPALALCARSLREESRARWTYVLRSVIVLLTLVMLVLARQFSTVMGAPGLWLFTVLFHVGALGVFLAALGYFAPAIAEEKEEGTLGLLQLAGLTPASVLLGKITGRMLVAGLVLVAQLPFVMLAVTLGGVSLRQVLSAMAALLAYVVLTAGLALVCSVRYATVRRATAAAAVLLFALSFLPLMTVSAPPAPLPAAALRLFNLSPFWRLQTICATGFSEPILSVSVWDSLAVGGFLFAAAWLIYDRFTRTHVDILPAASGTVFGSRFRAGRVGSRPLVWKDFHFLAGGRRGLVLRFLGLGLLSSAVALYLKLYTDRVDPEALGQGVADLSGWALWIELAVQAARMLGEEVHGRTWPVLAASPLSLRRILSDKAIGCLIGCVPAATFLALGTWQAHLAAWSPPLVGGPTTLEQWPLEASMFLFFMILTIHLSLRRRWGALFLSLGITYLGGGILNIAVLIPLMMGTWMGISSNLYEWLYLAFLPSIYLVGGAMVYRRMLRRLRAAAGEG